MKDNKPDAGRKRNERSLNRKGPALPSDNFIFKILIWQPFTILSTRFRAKTSSQFYHVCACVHLVQYQTGYLSEDARIILGFVHKKVGYCK